MVVAIIVYRFEMNTSASGDIEPEFKVMAHEIANNNKDVNIDSLITDDDLFGLFFNHTTGSGAAPAQLGEDGLPSEKNIITAKLKNTNYKVLSNFVEEEDESQFLVIEFFNFDEEIELYEKISYKMLDKIGALFNKLSTGNKNDFNFISQVEEEVRREISYGLFQTDRLSNLTKIQKVALIFTSEERVRTLDLLREGPISREMLRYELEKDNPNPNLGIVLKPFIELNLVRRDWAKGEVDRRKGIKVGEGEYLFLTKDVTLVRKPPSELLKNMERNEKIGERYKVALSDFYSVYDPFNDTNKESQFLANILLDPDMYDLISLFKTRTYPLKKMPKISSDFVKVETLLEELVNTQIIKYIEDDTGMKWVLLLADIVSMTSFPEFIVPNVAVRVHDEFKGKNYQKITKEVGITALSILENTYMDELDLN